MSLNYWLRVYNLGHNKLAALIACTAATALATITLTASPASAAYITVYGGPTYTPGVGGFHGGGSAHVNEAGIAVGSTSKYDSSGEYLGTRSFRWDASSAAPTELGNLGVNPSGYSNVRVTDINNAGTVVGEAEKFDAAGATLGERAVRWNASGTAAIELENLGEEGIARAINNAGTAVGSLGSSAARWDASGNLTELGDFDWGSSAWAINDAGTAVGTVRKPEIVTLVNDRAVRWGASGPAATELGNLGTAPGGRGNTEARDINDAGTAVGRADKWFSLFLLPRAVRWNASGTAATELGNLGISVAIGSYAEAVNNAGMAIGMIHETDGAFGSINFVASHGVRWVASGTATELGDLGTESNGAVPQDINNAGIAVGWASGSSFLGTRAVYWGLDAVAVDLNTLIDPAAGWTLTEAQHISDTGWIVGSGDFDPDGPGGQAAYQRLFLMHVPEPAMAVSFGIGLIGIVAASRRRVAVIGLGSAQRQGGTFQRRPA
jgi:PEP-CTERM motif-containing protein